MIVPISCVLLLQRRHLDKYFTADVEMEETCRAHILTASSLFFFVIY